MNTSDETTALARRAIVHLRNKTTDQAPDMMSQTTKAYTDAERYEREVDKIFRHLPIVVALSVELANPKSYKAMTLMEVPIVVVRGTDGAVRAFLNVCRH